MKAERDLLDSLEREIEEFHELRERCGRVFQLIRWPISECSSGSKTETPVAEAPTPA